MTDQTRARRASLPGYACLAALVLTALTLCVLICTRPARAADWMTPYLEQVQEWGVMRGDANGNLHEDRNINRAEFVTLVNRAFGYEDPSPNNPFSDVNPNDWFAEDISIAHQAGYFNGTSPNTASPYSLVTREQAAVLLGRCLRFQGVTGAANSTFTDMEDIGGWSRGLVQEAADLGIIQGYADGSFRPDLPITRGQMACFLVRALGTLVQEPGEQTSGGVYGNLTITTPGVKLKDTVVTGNLYLTGGVGLGNVELENVEVLGKIVICGGGEAEGGKHSVILRNVTAGALELDSLTQQFFSVEAEGLTNIDTVTARSSAYIEDRTEDGLGLQTIRLDGVEDSEFQLAGNLKRIIDLTPGSTLQIAQGVADVVTIDEKAEGASLIIDNLASIRELNLDRAAEVTGEGGVSHLNVNAPGSTVSMLPDTIYIRPGITANINRQNMDNKLGSESSEDPRILAGYPVARNIAPTSANAVFRTNKAGTIRWALTSLMDGSVGETELLDPSAYPKIIRSGTINVTASNTDFTARLSGLTRQGSYYISALLEDARGRRSPVKIAAFTTPDDTAPNFSNGYPQAPILTVDADNEQVAQVMVMATKDCQMYYALFPKGSTAPTAADFRAGALSGNLGSGVVTLRKNTPFLLSRINRSHLQEQTQYDLYLWLSDADNGKSSAVRKLTFTTKDMTPPTIQDLHMASNAARSVTLSFTLDEPGTLNWVVVKQGDNFGINTEDPTKTDQIRIEGVLVGGRVIRKGGPVRAARGGTAYSFTVSGLEPQTAYDLFYTAKDTAGNYCVYNKSIAFPYPIKTLDNEGPTASLDYSDKATDANGTERPWAESDVYIEFSEVVQGIGERNLDQPDDFYAAYQRVENSTGADQTSAKRDLAAMLQKYITFYSGNPPANTNARPRPETQVAVNDGSQTAERLESLPAWIDFREARVSREGAKTTITFPGNGVGLKLQSGQTYYFMLQNIEDTSLNAMVSPTYLRFNTAFATVNIFNNENEENVTYNGETRPAEIFYMVPEGTQAVSRDTRWDMIIWTNSSLKYDLLVRPRGSATEWKLLGTVSPNLSGSGQQEVYNSLNGNFNNNGVTTLISSGLFGSITADKGRPYLNEFVNELEFAIVPTESTVSQRVQMHVQIFAGTNTELASIARTQGTKATLDGRNITAIGDPDRFPIAIDPSDKAPTVSVPYQGIVVGDIAATVHLNVDRNGTVYYFAIPLNNVNAANPTGANYTMFETYPAVDGQKPDLKDIPTSWEDPALPLVWLDSNAPVPDDVVQGKVQSLTTKYGDTGNSLLSSYGTTVQIQGLSPSTTYLLYLVSTDTNGTPAKQTLCYKFSTTPPNPPKVQVTSYGNNRAEITVDKPANIYYILVRSQQLRSGAFSTQFITGSGLVDSSKGTLPSTYLNGGSHTVLDAMLHSVTDSAGNFLGSVFDLYATQTAKDTFFQILNDPNDEFQLELPVMRGRGTLIQSTTNPFTLTGMNGSDRYTLIVAARGQNSTSTGFTASREYFNLVSEYLYVISATPSANENGDTSPNFRGTVSVVFSSSLYFLPEEATTGSAYPVDSCARVSSQHVGAGGYDDCNLADGYVSIGSIMSSGQFSLTQPPQDQHRQSVTNQLTFTSSGNTTNGASISFIAGQYGGGLCGSNSSVRTSNRTLTLTLRSTRNTDGTYSWSVIVPQAWQSANG